MFVLWKIELHFRMLMLWWRPCNHLLPLKQFLIKHHVPCDMTCHCHSNSEDYSNLFLHCAYSRAIWFGGPLGLYTHTIQVELSLWILEWVKEYKMAGMEFRTLCHPKIITLRIIWRSSKLATMRYFIMPT